MELEAKIKVIYDTFFSMNNESSKLFDERDKIIMIFLWFLILFWNEVRRVTYF